MGIWFWIYGALDIVMLYAAMGALLKRETVGWRYAIGGLCLLIAALAAQMAVASALTGDLVTLITTRYEVLALLVAAEEVARLSIILIFIGRINSAEAYHDRMALGAWFGIFEAVPKVYAISSVKGDGLGAFCGAISEKLAVTCGAGSLVLAADILIVIVFHAVLSAVAYRRLDGWWRIPVALMVAIVLHTAFNVSGIVRSGEENLELRTLQLVLKLALIGLIGAVGWRLQLKSDSDNAWKRRAAKRRQDLLQQ